ncbi:hypothetical protein GCM10023196_037260 [Actinoallomurus vinaceus]|uniref:DUF2786 domain-containing protein n=1 Tax=Actinoallomurus vinaceus TaxID=1080074 RepID=A0ABP8U9C6_9ACTN
MTTTAATLLEKAQKLLAQAEDTGIERAEAAAFADKAATYLAAYGVKSLTSKEAREMDDVLVNLSNPWGREKAELIVGVATAMRCEAYKLSSRGQVRVRLFGIDADVERAQMMADTLLKQLGEVIPKRGEAEGERGTARAHRLRVIGEFTEAALEMVTVAERVAVGENSKALRAVLAKHKDAVDAAFTKAHPKDSKKLGREDTSKRQRRAEKSPVAGTALVPVWQPVAREDAEKGSTVTVKSKDGSRVTGALVGWGPKVVRVRDEEGKLVSVTAKDLAGVYRSTQE